MYNPSCAQVDDAMCMVENKVMEFNHPIFYETFR